MVDLKGIEPSNLTDANRALSQLSYRPIYVFIGQWSLSSNAKATVDDITSPCKCQGRNPSRPQKNAAGMHFILNYRPKPPKFKPPVA